MRLHTVDLVGRGQPGRLYWMLAAVGGAYLWLARRRGPRGRTCRFPGGRPWVFTSWDSRAPDCLFGLVATGQFDVAGASSRDTSSGADLFLAGPALERRIVALGPAAGLGYLITWHCRVRIPVGGSPPRALAAQGIPWHEGATCQKLTGRSRPWRTGFAQGASRAPGRLAICVCCPDTSDVIQRLSTGSKKKTAAWADFRKLEDAGYLGYRRAPQPAAVTWYQLTIRDDQLKEQSPT